MKGREGIFPSSTPILLRGSSLAGEAKHSMAELGVLKAEGWDLQGRERGWAHISDSLW